MRPRIDVDLAALYGVPTKRLNEQVKRNRDRFLADFLFRLTAAEKAEVVANCDHLGKLKYSKVLPYAFTEHGAMSAFVHLREAASVHADLAKRLADLEMKTESLELSHDTFASD